MKLEQSFEVAAPLDRVWQALIDVEYVAPCLPGAAITGRNEDGSYNGTFTVKIGPTTASYSGKLEMEEVDESSHHATMNAQGTDKRGQGGATAKIDSRLEPVDDGHTRVSVDTDYRITGRLARFGRGGMIEDISERLLREFAQRLQASLEAGGEAPSAEAEPEAPAGQGASEPAAPDPAAGDEPAPLAPDEQALAPTEAPETASTDAPEPRPTDAPETAPTDAPETAPTDAPEPASTDAPEPSPTDAPAAPPTGAPEPAPTDAPETAPMDTPEPARTPETPPPPPPPARPAAPPPPTEPLDAGSLVGSVLVDRIKANPWPWIAGALVLWRLLRRRR